MKALSAILAAFLLLAGGYTVGASNGHTDPDLSALTALLEAQQQEIAELRQAVENIEIPEPEEPQIIYVQQPVITEVTKEVEKIVYLEPEEPEEEPGETEESQSDPEDPTTISYCLMAETYAGGTFAYSFDGYLMTATLSYHYDAPPASHTFDLSQVGSDFEQGDLPIMPIINAWIDGPIIYLDLIGNGDPPARQTIDLIPRGE